ncbi:hypothetical protein [Halobacteriovorax sp. ZH2_bin.1]|uniref:hypothetical protein n=2 Tax=unclassified Halobacteriovorax TaxID=2639665 RepID=UPI0037215858
MNKNLILLIALILLNKTTFADMLSVSGDVSEYSATIPSIDKNKEVDNRIPGYKTIANIPDIEWQNNQAKAFDKAMELAKTQVKKLVGSEKQDNVIQQEKITKSENTPVGSVQDIISTAVSAPKRQAQKTRKRKTIKSNITKPNNGVMFFNPIMADQEIPKGLDVSIPSGSAAMGTLMAGIEIDDDNTQVDVRLDGAFIGPNNSYVTLKDCHVWLRLKPKYNKNRIEGESFKSSCRSESGKTYEFEMKGQLRDSSDEYIGLAATLNTINYEKGGLMSFGDKVTSSVGAAMAAAQVTSQISQSSGDVNPVTIENITGSQGSYIAGKTIEGSFSAYFNKMANWYWSMKPTLAVAPGTKVIITITDKASIPLSFFHEKDRSLLIYESLKIN